MDNKKLSRKDGEFPPEDQKFPPDGGKFPPDDKKFPPEGGDFPPPPDGKGFPPDGEGFKPMPPKFSPETLKRLFSYVWHYKFRLIIVYPRYSCWHGRKCSLLLVFTGADRRLHFSAASPGSARFFGLVQSNFDHGRNLYDRCAVNAVL